MVCYHGGSDQMSAVIEMDEIHTFVQKTGAGRHMDCL